MPFFPLTENVLYDLVTLLLKMSKIVKNYRRFLIGKDTFLLNVKNRRSKKFALTEVGTLLLRGGTVS